MQLRLTRLKPPTAQSNKVAMSKKNRSLNGTLVLYFSFLFRFYFVFSFSTQIYITPIFTPTLTLQLPRLTIALKEHKRLFFVMNIDIFACSF